MQMERILESGSKIQKGKDRKSIWILSYVMFVKLFFRFIGYQVSF